MWQVSPQPIQASKEFGHCILASSEIRKITEVEMNAWPVSRRTLLFFWALALLASTALAAEPASCLTILEGRHVQFTEYTYRLTLSPDGVSPHATVDLLDDVFQPWYHVSIEEQTVTTSVPTISRAEHEDSLGNRDLMLFWSGNHDEIVVERHVRATTEAIYGVILLPDPFPVPLTSLPWSCMKALEATDQVQSEDAAIVNLARSITQPCPTQLDAVVRVLSWIRREVEYACSRDLCDPVYRVDAVFTMEKKKGNCVSYANLAVALLRAVGIPAIEASGFVADRPSSRACHAWIAVYFPTSGWIEFESADWMPSASDWMPSGGAVPITFLMPQHLTIRSGLSASGVSNERFEEMHESSIDILERPEPSTSVVAAWSSQPIAWVMTVHSPTYEDARMELQVLDSPPGWEIVLSEHHIQIGENDVSRTVDVLVTAIPKTQVLGETVCFSVIALHDGQEVGRVAFQIENTP
jgi:hypothetical protein